MNADNIIIGVIGLGYVGLPIAVEFGKTMQVIGYDTKKSRVNDIKNFEDLTKELTSDEIKSSLHLEVTSNILDLASVNFFIVTVPTPVNDDNEPDLFALEQASRDVGKLLKVGDIVVYESTVYPGATEEFCVPILEEESKLIFNKDFFCGYSPERINPGDKQNTLVNIKKVVSGSTKEIAQVINDVYALIIKKGTFIAESIKVAEAAKVIENTQRDINIALINELSQIFNLMEIDTNAVLEAANTKWNFLPFKPGLVGGHCIGIDPYYLTYKARQIGYKPKIITSGRELNNHMSLYVVSKFQEKVLSKKMNNGRLKILIAGVTFKENCPDIRNSKVFDIFHFLESDGHIVDIYDPWVNQDELNNQYRSSFKTNNDLIANSYDGIIIAVAHQIFYDNGLEFFKSLSKEISILFDLKSIFKPSESDFRL